LRENIVHASAIQTTDQFLNCII